MTCVPFMSCTAQSSQVNLIHYLIILSRLQAAAVVTVFLLGLAGLQCYVH